MAGKFKSLIVVVLCVVLINTGLMADVKLPALFSDNMVLQQSTTVSIWGWADAGEKVQLKPSWNRFNLMPKTVTAGQDGKWAIKLKTPAAGGPFEILIKANNTITLRNVMSGEVWICSGQSNMEWPTHNTEYAKTRLAEANVPNIRLFEVEKAISREPLEDVTGSWQECSTQSVRHFSAVGYFFGKHLYEQLNVPIGLIDSNWGGTCADAWTRNEILQADEDFASILENQAKNEENYPTAIKKFSEDLKKWEEEAEKAKAEGKPAPRKPREPKPFHQNSPSSLYNGMIAPVIPYGMKGAIWYQGESNASRAYQYQKLFPAMITNWREDWQLGDFPFYFVQIAPYKNQIPEIRYAQLRSYRSTPNTGIVVTTDIGNPQDIHPRNKVDVGKRLALWALANDYGKKDLVYSGPLYREMKIEKQSIRLFFDFTEPGLVSVDGDLADFTIAGADEKFVPAKAVIDGDTILVSSKDVPSPVAVRFAWTNSAEPNLFNKAGLPASPFKTDNWKWDTQDNK